MRVSVRKMGNCFGIVIPKPFLTRIGVAAGDALDLSLDDGRIVLYPPVVIRAPVGPRRPGALPRPMTTPWSGRSSATPAMPT